MSRKQAQIMRDFNKKFKVGEKVSVKMDDGEIKKVTIQHPATMLYGEIAVGWFDEITGCYRLDRVQEI